MDNVSYLLSANSSCIEGICLTKKNNSVSIISDRVGFSELRESNSEEQISPDSKKLVDRLDDFLERQNWKDHAITFLLPAEDVTFRKITFPFYERKKVEQALPFELEEELMDDLAESAYSVQVHLLSDQNSEALVLLMKRNILEDLKQMCLKRNLLILNIDCAAFALFRSIYNNNFDFSVKQDLFQIYLGSDETFVNTIRDGRLDDIKIFPNRISEIINTNFSNPENNLSFFLHNLAKEPETKERVESKNNNSEAFSQIKEELKWLCSKLTLHLRIKNFTSDSQIEIHGIFGPLIKWDGIIFRIRSFPLPEAKAFAERSEEVLGPFTNQFAQFEKEKIHNQNSTEKAPDTLEELMIVAKNREESDENYLNQNLENGSDKITEAEDDVIREKSKTFSEVDHINQEETLLSLTDRKHWGILGDLRQKAQVFLKPHKLSLYHESTPWRRFFRRNQIGISIAASLILVITVSFIWRESITLNLLLQDIKRADVFAKSELRKILPQSSTKSINSMIVELSENIDKRKVFIENSNKFEKRDYFNLKFIKSISLLLSEEAPFQVDNLEYTTNRFSLSGTIDSYDRLQVLKIRLQEIDEFKNREMIESNRKSPEGIVYRITIELK